MTWTIYETATGEIVKTVSGQIEGQLEDGQATVEGDASWMTHTVVNGVVTSLSSPRVAPSSAHKWDRSTASWVDPRSLTQQLSDAWSEARTTRDTLLASSDWVILRQFELGGALPQAWAEYRQALRDITLQVDPFNLVWPTSP